MSLILSILPIMVTGSYIGFVFLLAFVASLILRLFRG